MSVMRGYDAWLLGGRGGPYDHDPLLEQITERIEDRATNDAPYALDLMCEADVNNKRDWIEETLETLANAKEQDGVWRASVFLLWNLAPENYRRAFQAAIEVAIETEYEEEQRGDGGNGY